MPPEVMVISWFRYLCTSQYTNPLVKLKLTMCQHSVHKEKITCFSFEFQDASLLY